MLRNLVDLETRPLIYGAMAIGMREELRGGRSFNFFSCWISLSRFAAAVDLISANIATKSYTLRMISSPLGLRIGLNCGVDLAIIIM